MDSQLLTAKENTIITWFNDSQMGNSDDIQTVKDQLGENNVGILFIFDDVDGCVDFINDVKDNRIILIIGPTTGAKVLRRVLEVSQIQVVFLVCSNHAMRPIWATECGPIRCITVNSTSVYQQIEIFITNHTVGIDILDSSIIPTNQNKFDARFVYCQILKYVLTGMIYSNDDTNDMIEFFRNKFKHQPITLKSIEEFGKHYEPNKAIWFYTNYIFLYKTVNSALRTFDIRALYAMRVFLKDLHLQIARLHVTTQIIAVLKLYRGVVMPTTDFEKIKDKTGKLLSFNDFLSTSKNQNVALMFASSSLLNEIAVIFEITIDPSMLTDVAFSSIQGMSQYGDEEEYLFTTGSIFRIESIGRQDENSRWCIHLTLTADDDPETTELIKYMQSKFKYPNIDSLSILLEYMGQHDVTIDIINTCINSCKNKSTLPKLYIMLGGVYMELGNFQSALEAFQLFHEVSNHLDESECNMTLTAIATLSNHFIHGNFDLALSDIEAMKQNILFDDPTRYLDILKSEILLRQGLYKDVFEYQNEACNRSIETLPALHPSRIMYFLKLSVNFTMANQSDDVSLIIKQARKFQKHALPPGHFLQELLDASDESDKDNKYDDLPFEYSIDNLSEYMTPLKLNTVCPQLIAANKCDEALLILNQYIKFHEERSTIRHADLVDAYQFRGICHKKKRNLIEALNDFKQSYEIGTQHFGKTHWGMLSILVDIINIYIELDNYDQASFTIEQYKNLINTDPQLSSTERKKSLFEVIFLTFKRRALKQYCSKEYEKAVHGFKSYLEIQIYVLSHDHPDVGETYQSIGMAYKELGYYSGALYNYKKAQNVFEKHLPSNDSKIGDIWNDLWLIYCKLEQYDDALFACKKYLEFLKNVLPSSHIDIAEAYVRLANLYQLKKDFLNAIENYRRALIIQLEYLPETCSKTIETLRNLGTSYDLSNQYEESLMAFYECLEYQLNILPSAHIDVGETYQSIGMAYKELGYYSGALYNYKKAQNIFEKHLPSNDSKIGDIWDDLRVTYARLKQYDDAIFAGKKYVEFLKNVLPSSHIDIAEAYVKIACLYRLKKDFLNAIENNRRALIIQLEYLPETCSKTIKTLYSLGMSYKLSNQYEESLMTFYECLEYQLNILPSAHIDVSETYNSIALAYFKLKRFDEAFQNFEICLFIKITLLPPDHPDIADTQNLLGETALQLHNYALAATHYEYALEIRQKHLPAMNTKVIEILKMLEIIYRELKRYDDSRRAFEQRRIFELNRPSQ